MAKRPFLFTNHSVFCNGQSHRRHDNENTASQNQLEKSQARLGAQPLHGEVSSSWNLSSHRSQKLDYGWTCRVASPVTIGIACCCEFFALTSTMDRFDVPGASAFTTIPTIVPVPLTPGVFGWRVAEMIIWPLSLKGCDTMAISWLPPERKPACPPSPTACWISSMLITAGLYCTSMGMEKRSFT